MSHFGLQVVGLFRKRKKAPATRKFRHVAVSPFRHLVSLTFSPAPLSVFQVKTKKRSAKLETSEDKDSNSKVETPKPKQKKGRRPQPLL
jgi:hypothetical protein